jgi:LTXXQ motif family protein
LIAPKGALILPAVSQEVHMKKVLLAGIAALAIAGSTVVYAQQRPWFHDHVRMSPEDRAAFADARIAAVHAGLKLTPDQEKLWPPVETAVRDFAKLRIDRANARMKAAQDDSRDAQKQDSQNPADPVARLRERADTMATTAASLKKIADAADPLYKTLDDGQKRRLSILTHMERRIGGGEGWRHRGMDRGGDRDRDGGDRDRGYNRDRGYDRDGGSDHGGRGGPERL